MQESFLRFLDNSVDPVDRVFCQNTNCVVNISSAGLVIRCTGLASNLRRIQRKRLVIVGSVNIMKMLSSLVLRRNVTLGKSILARTLSQSLQHSKVEAFSQIPPAELGLSEPEKLRGRRFLPGADKDSFPELLKGPRQDFPLALEAHGDYSIQDWGKLCRQEIDRSLLKYGAILFRKLPLVSVDDFQSFFLSVDFPPMTYVGGSAYRESVSSKVYSASDEPPECCIDLHNEMSYSPNFNKKVCFLLAFVSFAFFALF